MLVPTTSVARGVTLALGLLLMACTTGAPGPGPRPLAKDAARRSAPPAVPSGADGVPSPGGPSLVPAAAPARLQRPAGTRIVAGRITIEAAYAITQGATLLSDHGGGIVSNNGGAVLGVAGAQRDAAGRVVSNNGGGILSDGGGAIVAPHQGGVAPYLGDGTLLAGGGLISDNGGGLITDNGAGYRVVQAPPALPPVGTELPAAGMVVGVVDLGTRRHVPIGRYPDGRPAYAVFSGADGGFELGLPEAAGRSLLVVASVPGSRDRRLSFNVFPAAAQAPLAVDERERMASRYLRTSFTSRLVATFRLPDLVKLLAAGEPSFSPAARDHIIGMVDRLQALKAEARLPEDLGDEAWRIRAQRIVDRALARLDLNALAIEPTDIVAWRDRPPTTLRAAFRDVLGTCLDGAAAKLRAEPDAFGQAFLASEIHVSETGLPLRPLGDWRGAIRTPGDVAEFMLEEYLNAKHLNAGTALDRLYRVLHAASGAEDPEAAAKRSTELLGAAGYQLMVTVARELERDEALQRDVVTYLADPDAP